MVVAYYAFPFVILTCFYLMFAIGYYAMQFTIISESGIKDAVSVAHNPEIEMGRSKRGAVGKFLCEQRKRIYVEMVCI